MSRTGAAVGIGRVRSSAAAGGYLRWARRVGLLLSAAIIAMFVAGLPVQYDRFVRLHGPEPYGEDPAATLQRLRASGWTAHQFAVAVLSLDVLLAAGFTALGVMVVVHRGRDWWTLGFAVAMTAFGCTFALVPDALAARHPAMQVPVSAATVLGLAGGVLVLLLFPDGRPVRRWLLAVPAAYAVWIALRQVPAASRALDGSALPVAVLVVGAIVGAQVARYRRADLHERDQLRWAAAGIAAGLLGFLLFGYVVPALAPTWTASGSVGSLVVTAGLFLALLLVPAGMALALVWSRLWDVDIAVNRTLVYGTLSAGIIAVYGGLVAAATRLGTAEGAAVAVAVSVSLAMVLNPARAAIQRRANQLMYGQRDDPHAAVSLLGQRLAQTAESDDVLATIVTTVRSSLRVPYARIALASGTGEHVAEAGSPSTGLVCVPMVHRGEQIGVLCAAARRGESLHRRDRAFLIEIAGIAAPAAAAVRLTRDLQRSRERLVLAREEERRRIRNDLHDGVGPALASIRLKAAALRRRLPDGSDLAPALEELRHDASHLAGEVRTLARALRPPVLDTHGLPTALQQLADALGEDAHVQVTTELPGELALPAAVEAALYRIAQEGTTNVLRHAHATTCRLALRVTDGAVELTVADDGTGLPSSPTAGVGLTSMQERAAELGGRCTVAPAPTGGTVVRVRIPLGAAHD